MSHKGRQASPHRGLWNPGQHPKGRSHRLKHFSWLRKFPIKLFLGMICVFLLFEIFTLPISSIFSLDTKSPKETALMQQGMKEAQAKGKKLPLDYHWISILKESLFFQLFVPILKEEMFIGGPMCYIYK